MEGEDGIPVALRVMNGNCESSTQAMAKLLDFQHTTDVQEYQDKAELKKTLQDVVTRWRSTYRMRRLRFLKKAIKFLVTCELINYLDLSDEEWMGKMALETMANYRRILEGESYVTASMVAVAVFQIRKSYLDVIDCQYTKVAVVRLTKILLKDFDNRYFPSEGGRVKYFREAIATLECDYVMAKNDLIHLMVSKTKLKRNNDESSNPQDSASAFVVATPTTNTISKQSRKLKHMFRGLNTKPQTLKNSNTQRKTMTKSFDTIVRLN
jgi:hypothetical protein